MSINKLLYNYSVVTDLHLMKNEKKKRPSDYPQMAFRLSLDDKEKLSALIDEIHVAANKKISSDQKTIKKNDIIIEAMFSGLKIIKKKY